MRPSFPQQFSIFHYKDSVETEILKNSNNEKTPFYHLTSVIQYENLLAQCKNEIEKVTQVQIEFWIELLSQLPNLNELYDMASKIYENSREAAQYWDNLNAINPNNSKANKLYGTYLIEIKKNIKFGEELLERAKQINKNKSLGNFLNKSSDVVFAEDTVVIHISGSTENAGRITTANNSIVRIFGYKEPEVVGHLVNILMPTIFARKHGQFLDSFFTSGKGRFFNQEGQVFALHRNGCCFGAKLLVKQVPNLEEGIQYVGMIRPFSDGYDYFILNEKGTVDSFTNGISKQLGLPASLFKENEINIERFLPEIKQIARASSQENQEKNKDGFQTFLLIPQDFADKLQIKAISSNDVNLDGPKKSTQLDEKRSFSGEQKLSVHVDVKQMKIDIYKNTLTVGKL